MNIKYVDISREITYEDFASKLSNYTKDNEDVALDIVHSFRYIPMKLLFALRYIFKKLKMFQTKIEVQQFISFHNI